MLGRVSLRYLVVMMDAHDHPGDNRKDGHGDSHCLAEIGRMNQRPGDHLQFSKSLLLASGTRAHQGLTTNTKEYRYVCDIQCPP